MDAPAEPPDSTEATRVDARGRVVVVTTARLEHIAMRHPEVRSDDVLAAIERARQRTRGATVGGEDRETLWAEKVGRNRWLAVVVAYVGRTGRVVTAYGTNRGPKPSDLL
jgi:hypothetical protein